MRAEDSGSPQTEGAQTGRSQEGQQQAQPETRRKIATGSYFLVGFLMLLNVLNFVDRQLLASFANFIKPDLGLTDTQFGLLTGFAFIVFYSVMGLFAGALADRWHRPRLIAMGVGLWSLLTAASGAAANFTQLLVARMLIGVGESTMTPTSMSLMADRFPREVLGTASGIYYVGVPLGVGVSLMIAGYLGPAIGWRNCFYVLGAIGLVMALAMLLVRDPQRTGGKSAGDADVGAAGGAAAADSGGGAQAVEALSSSADAAGAAPARKGLILTVIETLQGSPALTLTIAGGVTMHFILGAAAFDQLWLVEERGFDRAEIAIYSGWIACVFGIIGNLAGGMLGDWWLRTFQSGRTMFLFWLSLLMLPLSLAYRWAPVDGSWTEWVFWMGMAAGWFQLGAFYGPTFSTVQELAPERVRATVVAFYILSLNLVGLGIGATLGGVMIDELRSAGFAEPYTITLLVMTALSAVSVVFFFAAGRRFHGERSSQAA